MGRSQHIDAILRQWPYDPATVNVRRCTGHDGRALLQVRIDMGVLQLEIDGRPDGSQPEGHETYLDYLNACVLRYGPSFRLDEDQCAEVDREFVQFYHRRVCWLKLQEYDHAVLDADHTLALMDFCQKYSPDADWTLSHEQFRPFVLFHRIQAAALIQLSNENAEVAIYQINQGLDRIRAVFAEHNVESEFDEDELVKRLVELRESLREEYGVGRTLQERLAEAVATEQYELAAHLRDELQRRGWQH